MPQRALPGISEDEAAEIVHSELGLELSQQKIQRPISKSRIIDLRNGGRHTYVLGPALVLGNSRVASHQILLTIWIILRSLLNLHRSCAL